VNSYATAGSSEIRSLVSAYQTSVLAAPPVACGVGLPALGGGWSTRGGDQQRDEEQDRSATE